jgi:spore coat polysaccharide biosynthesis protein SpsF
MRTAIFVQARMTSTRLPGKILLPVLGRPLLSYQVERLRRVRGVDAIVIATTVNVTDEPVVAFCEAEGLPCVRGSELDVLGRFHDALLRHSPQVVVRITSDCPLLDPDVVEAVLREFHAPGGCDYASNMIQPTFPYGMAVEVMTAAALAEAHARAREPAEREHVTPYLYWRPQRFRLRSVTMSPDLSHHRWTVDTPEDFELVKRLIESLYPRNPDFRMNDVLALLRERPEWVELNRHVQQKSTNQSQGASR